MGITQNLFFPLIFPGNLDFVSYIQTEYLDQKTQCTELEGGSGGQKQSSGEYELQSNEQ